MHYQGSIPDKGKDRIFSHRHRVQTATGDHTHLPVPEILTPRLKRSGLEADHSPPSSAEVKNAWSYISTSPIRLHGVVLS